MVLSASSSDAADWINLHVFPNKLGLESIGKPFSDVKTLKGRPEDPEKRLEKTRPLKGKRSALKSLLQRSGVPVEPTASCSWRLPLETTWAGGRAEMFWGSARALSTVSTMVSVSLKSLYSSLDRCICIYDIYALSIPFHQNGQTLQVERVFSLIPGPAETPRNAADTSFCSVSPSASGASFLRCSRTCPGKTTKKCRLFFAKG